MNPKARAALARYAVALASVIAATVLRKLFDPLVGEQVPFVTLFGAVAFSAWYGGLGPGLFAVAASCFAAGYLFIPPRGEFPRDAAALSSLALFLAMAGMIAFFFHLLGTSRRTADRVAEQLRIERERFRVTLSSIGDAVIVTDTAARITFMNAVAEQLTAWTSVEAVGQPLERVFRIVNETSREPVDSPVAKALREGTIVGLANHTSLLAKDGTEWAIDDSAAPVRDEFGRVIGVVMVFRDVSDRRGQQRTLLESEERFRTLFESSPLGKLSASALGRILKANPAICGMLGYECPEFETLSLADVTHPDDRAALAAAVADAEKSGGSTFTADLRLLHKSGHVIWTRVTGRTIRNEAGPMTIVTIEDVTQRRGAEQQIRFQARLIAAVEQAVLVTDASGIVTSWNPFAERLTGWPAARAIGQDLIGMLIPERERQSFTRILEQLRGGESWSGELVVRRHDGALIPTVMTFTPVVEQGLTAIIGIATDISSQKQTEASLRFLSNASRSLADLIDYRSTLQRVASLAVPGFADWCAVDMRQTDGTVQRVATAHADPEKVAAVEAITARRVLDPESQHGLMRILRTGQSELIPEFSEEFLATAQFPAENLRIIREFQIRSYIGVPLIAHGNTFGVLTFIRSESGRNFTEEDLRLAEDLAHRAAVAIENARLYSELRDADRRKDEFLAMLAHELRNPLAPIRTGLDILAMQHGGGEPTDVIEVMQRQVEHLVRLVDDLLDVSRIVGGRIELRREPVELATIINRSVEAVRPAIERSGHQLSVSLPSEPVAVEADMVRMVQVVENLLNNACKYTEPGGRIEVLVDREQDGVRVRVRDTGIGIEPELLPHVFELFTQSDRTLDRSQGGLGIGLTLVRNLVEMHGGTVTAHSDGPGRGSEFTIRLPVCSAPVEAPSEPAAEQNGQAVTHRILVVEDNVGMARMVGRLLTHLGPHQVELAHDGPSALSKMNAMKPEIVFLDIGLPGMDGYTIARAIRRDPANDPVLLVALTGYGQDDDRRRSREAGFDEHLVKPPALQSIRATLAHPKLARST